MVLESSLWALSGGRDDIHGERTVSLQQAFISSPTVSYLLSIFFVHSIYCWCFFNNIIKLTELIASNKINDMCQIFLAYLKTLLSLRHPFLMLENI